MCWEDPGAAHRALGALGTDRKRLTWAPLRPCLPLASYAATAVSLWEVLLRRLLLPLVDTKRAAGPPAVLMDSPAGAVTLWKVHTGKILFR